MKKLVSLLLALALILSLSAVAFAAEDTSLTITNSEGRTYNGYKLLDLTTSLKTGTHHPDSCDGTNHSDDCYNYAYTVNEKYREILQQETFGNGGNYLWEGGSKPSDATQITDDQILKYLSNQTSDNGDVYQTMRQVADRLYRAILAGNIAADAPNLTGNSTIEQGYWMFADVTELDGEASNSLVMVDTKGQTAITINPKTAIPTVEKKVKDIDDSEDGSITDNPWQDSADHDIGNTVPFKLTATLPSNAQYYQTYTMIFHDTMSAGLPLDPNSVKVYMYETKHKADVDIDPKNVTSNFSVTTTGLTDGCTFEVGCKNIYTIDGVTKDTAFVVYYEATLNENAGIDATGNPNEVYLEFSNNPYEEGTGKTKKDKVTVFTYQLTVNKTDSHGHSLEGAGFTLYKKNVEGNYNAIGSELKVGADGKLMTTFTWEGLDDGDYKLEETTVPEGYNKMADIVFSISATHDETSDDPKLTSLDGGLMGTGDVSTGTITKAIVNNTGTVLPETGAEGTFMLISMSAMVVMVAVVFMVTRKKMSIYED